MFWTRLVELCDEKRTSPTAVVKLLHIGAGSVTKWKNGTTPRGTTLLKLSEYFGVSADYLLGNSNNKNNATAEDDELIENKSVAQPMRIIEKTQYTSQEKALIDLFRETSEKGRLKMIQAFMDIRDEEARLSRTATILIPHSLLSASAGPGEYLNDESSEQWRIELNSYTRQADFCVTISGDSMEPTFKDGDIVLVHAQDSVDTGDIGLFSVNGDGYIKEAAEGVLVSHNEVYEDIVIGSEDKVICFGKVLGTLEKDWVVEQ